MPKYYVDSLEGRTQAALDAMDAKYGRRDETHIPRYNLSPEELADIATQTSYGNHTADGLTLGPNNHVYDVQGRDLGHVERQIK